MTEEMKKTICEKCGAEIAEGSPCPKCSKRRRFVPNRNKGKKEAAMIQGKAAKQEKASKYDEAIKRAKNEALDNSIDSKLLYSILALIFLNPLLGVIAVIYAWQAREAKKVGNVHRARSRAKLAQMFIYWAMALMAVTILVVGTLQFLGVRGY